MLLPLHLMVVLQTTIAIGVTRLLLHCRCMRQMAVASLCLMILVLRQVLAAHGNGNINEAPAAYSWISPCKQLEMALLCRSLFSKYLNYCIL